MSFYNFIKNAQTGADELYIDGEIASEESWWGSSGQIVARKFRQQLARCKDVVVYINSPGGEVFAGAEIYTALHEHKGKVTVKISGIAASAASVIAMAGDEVLMSPVAYMMIHDPWTFAIGNATEMEHMATILHEIGEGLIAAYTAKTGKSRDEIKELLKAETYMSAQTCIDEGFADGILQGERDAAEPADQKPAKAMMRANRYGPAAVCAMMREAEAPPADLALSFGPHSHPLLHTTHDHTVGVPAPAHPEPESPKPPTDSAKREEIAKRARLVASLYLGK